MSNLRDLPGFEEFWSRCTSLESEAGGEIHLLSIPDLVNAKKTQREKGWPVTEAFVRAHYDALKFHPTAERLEFWLLESRATERLIELCSCLPEEADWLLGERPLLALAIESKQLGLREELDAERRREQDKDRLYWEPLKREMEEFRRAERAADPDGDPIVLTRKRQ
jgi:hypothetical protein